MRLLVYDSGNHDSDAAAKLRALATRQGWSIARISQRRAFATQLEAAADFREWLLLHEREAKSGRWQTLSARHADAFVGFGGGSALLAHALTAGVPKIAIVERFDSDRLASRRKHDATIAVSRRLELQTAYHRRIEMELLRTFDWVIANPALVPMLIEHGLSNISSDIEGLQRVLTVAALTRKAISV